jgi:hypothetical protein
MRKTIYRDMKILAGLMLFLLLSACKNGVSSEEHKPIHIQIYVDSCTSLYHEAINEIKQGVDKDSIKKRYSEKIIFVHFLFKKTFDSITSAYTNKKLSQEEYDSFRKSIILDSVQKSSEELSKLGVDIKLG